MHHLNPQNATFHHYATLYELCSIYVKEDAPQNAGIFRKYVVKWQTKSRNLQKQRKLKHEKQAHKNAT